MTLKQLWAKKDWLERRRDRLTASAEVLRERSWRDLGLPEPEVWKVYPRPRASRDAAMTLARVQEDLSVVWSEIGKRASSPGRKSP